MFTFIELFQDKSVRHYVPEWPERHPDITVRQLVSHLSGIRHYDKKKEESSDQTKDNNRKKRNNNNNNNNNGSRDTEFKEFYLNQKFESVSKALDLFKDDELLSKPGKNSKCHLKAKKEMICCCCTCL